MKKIVIFGGGSGLSQLLKGLKLFPIEVTAVVSVSDNGRSTGRLRKDYNIPAVGDISKVLKIRNLCKENLNIYSGNDDQIIPILSLGGIGVISVLSNVIPKYTSKMIEKYFKGNVEEVIEKLEMYNPLILDTLKVNFEELFIYEIESRGGFHE